MFLESWRPTLSKRISKEPHFLLFFPGSYLTSLSANFFASFFISEIVTSTSRISVWHNQGGSSFSAEKFWTQDSRFQATLNLESWGLDSRTLSCNLESWNPLQCAAIGFRHQSALSISMSVRHKVQVCLHHLYVYKVIYIYIYLFDKITTPA